LVIIIVCSSKLQASKSQWTKFNKNGKAGKEIEIISGKDIEITLLNKIECITGGRDQSEG
jgi:hypothetical protein